MLNRIAFFLAVLGLLTAPALAQGVAFSSASNGGFGSCFGSDVFEASTCAQENCAAVTGLSVSECTVSLWCSPHTWFAAIAITPVEGAPYFDFLCNEPTFEKVEEVIAVTCNYEGYASCEVFQVWDPSGVAQYEQQ